MDVVGKEKPEGSTENFKSGLAIVLKISRKNAQLAKAQKRREALVLSIKTLKLDQDIFGIKQVRESLDLLSSAELFWKKRVDTLKLEINSLHAAKKEFGKIPRVSNTKGIVSFELDRMMEALSQESISIPPGLTKEERRLFILRSIENTED